MSIELVQYEVGPRPKLCIECKFYERNTDKEPCKACLIGARAEGWEPKQENKAGTK